MKNEIEMLKWFELYEKFTYDSLLINDFLNDLSSCKEVAAIIFLHSKLKEAYKKDKFLIAEHLELYTFANFDKFEDFSEEEVKIACHLRIYVDKNNRCFVMPIN